jgi:valyl-tRNA synthetase
VNPHDPRADDLVGQTVVLPIVDREVPIIADEYVVIADPESSDVKAQFASGFLKVTPAHDPNDWEIGLRHGLAVINVMGPDGSISDRYGWDDVSDDARPFVGLSREDARDAVVTWFAAHGLLEDARDYTHSVGHSYRSHVPVEPWLSDQWYVRVTDDRLRGAAIRAQVPDQVPNVPDDVGPRTGRAGDGELRFYPDRYATSYLHWHEHLRDWCISRQLWWGHQIPVWLRTMPLDDADEHVRAALARRPIDEPVLIESRWTNGGARHVVRKVTETDVEEAVCVPPAATLRRLARGDHLMSADGLIADLERAGYRRDPDVLDTWFSSGLWPMSTMGWPWPEDHPETIGLLDSFNPTSVLSTAREIITLWVSRMVMFNRYFLDGQLPFRDVFIHAMVQDGQGQKMSKSLGNGVDPRDIIHSHGADAMRFTLVQMTTDTQDVRMPVDMIDPFSGATFEPEYITTPAGHRVAAPIQTSPTDPSQRMVSAFGVASGVVEPTEQMPLARNTSSRFDLGRNFANKLWNATRFALRRIDPAHRLATPVELATRPFADRWIVARLAQTVDRLDTAIAAYQFNSFADTLYDFVWHDVCDRYLEMVKPTIDDDVEQQVVLGNVLDAVLRLMHPVMPFVTEALWPSVTAARIGDVAGLALPAADLLAAAAWPVADDHLADTGLVLRFERADELVGRIRAIRGSHKVTPRKLIDVYAPAAVRALVDSVDGVVEVLAGIGSLHGMEHDPPVVASPITFEGSEVLLTGLVDDIDLDAERARLMKVVEGKSKQITGFHGRLSNEGFLANARPEVVADTQALLAAAEADLAAAQSALARLD